MAEDIEAAAYAFLGQLEGEAEEIDRKYVRGILKWKTRDGKKILVQNMDDNHIINAKKLCEQRAKKQDYPFNLVFSAWIRIFEDEITKREIIL